MARILAVNAGSSSLKLSLLDGAELAASTTVETGGGGHEEEAVRDFVSRVGRVDAVGHRIVHGGTDFTSPTVVDDRVRRRLEELTDLAPLHQPKSLRALDAACATLPDTPAVACFDTAFHAGMPAAAATYALPAEWRRRWTLRRFGFHGLSHAYASRRTAELLGRPVESLRTVVCHLGAGASVAAVAGGTSVDTTMGFTPLEGLVMATRSGSVDPGLVLWLEEHAGMPPRELASALEHRSGMLGLAGTADMRAVLEAEAGGDGDAGLAVEVYLHRLRAGVAAMAAGMGGLDALTFTGGIGEHSSEIRDRAVEGLRFLGVAVDRVANGTARPDCCISPERAVVPVLVVEAREDLQIGSEVSAALGWGGSG